MLRGELDNTPCPVVAVLAEGLVILPARKLERPRWRPRAPRVRDYTINEAAVVATQSLWYSADVNVDLIVFQPQPFADDLAVRLEDSGMLLHAIHAMTPEDLLYCIPRWPQLYCIHDPDPQRLFTWGGKGRHTPPEDAHLIGRL